MVATGDLFRAAVRDGTPLGIEARRYMDAGQLVPDDIVVRLLLDRLGRPDAAARRDPRRLPADRGPGRRRSTRRSRSAASEVAAAVLVDVPEERGHAPHVGALDLPRGGPPVPRASSARPHAAGICDIDGSELYQRADDKPDTVRARMAQQLGALDEVIDHYRESGALLTGRRPPGHPRGRPATSTTDWWRPASPPAEGRLGGAWVITRKSKAEIAKMRSAGRIVAEVLALMEEHLAPGVSTADLDRIAERHIRGARGTPSFLNYLGGRRYDAHDPHAYPASTCISIDDEIVHGIPGDREVKAGQIVSIDVGVIYDGWHGDGARSFVCGGEAAGTPEAVGLVAGDPARAHGRHRGRAARLPRSATSPPPSRTSRSRAGYGIIRQYVGHGIGTSMHEDPNVPNFRTRSPGIELAAGHCFAIEPMFTLGNEDTEVLEDGWTVATADGSLAAHFEHTIAVTDDGPEILTRV